MSFLRSSSDTGSISVAEQSLIALISAINHKDVQVIQQGDARLRQMSERVLRLRRAQRKIFPVAALREGCWDILLLCLEAELSGRHMCVKQIRCELEESQTSVLRRIAELEQAGMLLRRRDDTDGRRTLLRLTGEATDALSRFFEMIEEPSQ